MTGTTPRAVAIMNKHIIIIPAIKRLAYLKVLYELINNTDIGRKIMASPVKIFSQQVMAVYSYSLIKVCI